MKFFLGPKKLWELYQNKDAIAEKMKIGKDTAWYLSEEGKEAYENANTGGKKVKYFFDYLCTLDTVKNSFGDRSLIGAANGGLEKISEWTKAKDGRFAVLYKIAHIMANSMDKSSLPFGGYPNILQADKNPLIHSIQKTGFETFVKISESTKALVLLAALYQGKEPQKKYHVNESYKVLTPCGDNGEFTDKYKVERDILGAFYDGNEQAPYTYDISKVGDN